MVKSAEPRLRKEEDVSDDAPGRPYKGDIRIWAGLLLLPLVILALAFVFGNKTPDAVTEDCNFAAWVNKPLDIAAVQITKRPYRISDVGRALEPSGEPTMINIEMDARKTVLKVWCG